MTDIPLPFGPAGSVDQDTAVVTAYQHRGRSAHRYYKDGRAIRAVAGDCAELEKSRKYVRKIQRKLERALQQGKYRPARMLAGTLWRSKASKIVAAAAALKSMKFQGRCPTAMEVAAYVWEDRRRDERVIAKRIIKGDGRFRLLFSYGLCDKVRQHHFRQTFGRLLKFHPSQYGVPGKDRNAAVKRVGELIQSDQHRFGLELDIRDCFGSVNVQELINLRKLPPETQDIISNIGKEAKGLIQPKEIGNHQLQVLIHTNARRLPQGLLTSPALAFSLFKEVLEEMDRRYGSKVAVIAYCDNFLILAASRDELMLARKSLVELLSAIPCAMFGATNKSGVRRLCDGIDFLGFRFQRKRGRPVISIRPCKKFSFLNEMHSRVRQIEFGIPNLVCARDVRIEHAVRWTLAHLPQFLVAPRDCRELMWRIGDAFRPYLATEAFQPMRRFIEKLAATDREVEMNYFKGRQGTNTPTETRARRPKIVSLANIMMRIPSNFRLEQSATSARGASFALASTSVGGSRRMRDRFQASDPAVNWRRRPGPISSPNTRGRISDNELRQLAENMQKWGIVPIGRPYRGGA